MQKKLDVDEDFFETHDLHIHVPAGAIPKDGPSAGVTMLTALTSLLKNKTIDKDLAMTGEITLRGSGVAGWGCKGENTGRPSGRHQGNYPAGVEQKRSGGHTPKGSKRNPLSLCR